MNESGSVCQQSGCSHLSDVCHAAKDNDALGRNGELKLKSAKDSLSDQRTSTKDKKILRKCKRYQERGFVSNQSGEESDEDKLKKFVHVYISTLCAACFDSLNTELFLWKFHSVSQYYVSTLREALEAILQENKRAKMRADEFGPSGWYVCEVFGESITL